MYILELNHGGGEIHRYFLLPGREYTIGRKECDILLPLGEPSISRHHATLKVAPMPRYAALDPKSELEITLFDFSKHGTFVDRERVGKDISRFLYPEDHIRFGMRVTGRVIPVAFVLTISPMLPDALLEIVIDAAVQLGAHVVEDRVPSPQEFYDRHMNCLGFLFVCEEKFNMDVPMMESLGYGYTLVTPNYLRTLAAEVTANVALPPMEFPPPVSPAPGSMALRSVHYRRPAQTFFEVPEFLSLGKPIVSRVFRTYTFLLIEDPIKATYNRVLEIFGGAVVQVAVDNLTLWKHMPTEPTTVILLSEQSFQTISELAMKTAEAESSSAALSIEHADPVIAAYLELYNNYMCMIPEENVHLALYRDDPQELNRKPTACYLQRVREGVRAGSDLPTEAGEAEVASAPAGSSPSARETEPAVTPAVPNGSTGRSPSAPTSPDATAAAIAAPTSPDAVRESSVHPSHSPAPDKERAVVFKKSPARLSGSLGRNAASAPARHSGDGEAAGDEGASVATPHRESSQRANAEAGAGEESSPERSAVAVAEASARVSASSASNHDDEGEDVAGHNNDSDDAEAAAAAPPQAPTPSKRSRPTPTAAAMATDAVKETPLATRRTNSTSVAATEATERARPVVPTMTQPQTQQQQQQQQQPSSRLPPKNTVSAAMRAVEAGVSRRATTSEQRRLPVSSAPASTTEKSPSPDVRDPYEHRGAAHGRRNIVVHEAAQTKQSPPRMRVEAVRIGSARRPSLAQEPRSQPRGPTRSAAPPSETNRHVDARGMGSAEAEEAEALESRGTSGGPVHRGVVRRATTRRESQSALPRPTSTLAGGSADFHRSDSSRIREMNAATPLRLTSSRISSSAPRQRPPAQSQPFSSSGGGGGSAMRSRQSPTPRDGPASSAHRRHSPYVHSSTRRRRSQSNPNGERLVAGSGSVPGQIPGLRAGSVSGPSASASQVSSTEGYANDALLGQQCNEFMRDFLDGFMTNTERTTRAVLRQTYLDSTSKQYLEDGVGKLQDFLQHMHRAEQEIPALYSTEPTRKSCHEVRQKATYTLRKIKGTYDAVHAEVPACLTKARDALSSRTMSPRRHVRYNSVSTMSDAAYRRQNFRDRDF